MAIHKRKRKNIKDVLAEIRRDLVDSFIAMAHGKESLDNAFFGHLVTGLIVLNLAAIVFDVFTQEIRPFFIFGIAAWGVWSVIGTWRCAFNTSRRLYGHLARAISPIAVIGAIVVLLEDTYGL